MAIVTRGGNGAGFTPTGQCRRPAHQAGAAGSCSLSARGGVGDRSRGPAGRTDCSRGQGSSSSSSWCWMPSLLRCWTTFCRSGASWCTWTLLGLFMLASSPAGAPCEHHYSSMDLKQGTFQSPLYPEPYPTHANCRYFFHGTIDERVRIAWEVFDLEEGTTAGCLFDYVDIFTIDINRMKDLEDRLCGQAIPDPIVSLHLTVEINFKSDYTGTIHKGFLGHYEFIDERWQPFPSPSPACGADYFGPSMGGGVITSPGFPEPYPPNVECTWMIRVKNDNKILLNFVELDLGQSVHCSATYVTIYNGFASADGGEAERVCGQMYFYDRGVKEFKSKTFRVVLRFKSDSVNALRSRGFKIAWTAVKIPGIVQSINDEWVEEKCPEMQCIGGEYCLDNSGVLCAPLPQYCIAKSLWCNGVANCGAYDHSDEEGCFTTILLVVLGTLGPILGIGLVSGLVYIGHKRGLFRKSASQEQSLTMTLQKLERSPTATKRFLDEKSNGTSNRHLNNDTSTATYTCTDTPDDLSPTRSPRRGFYQPGGVSKSAQNSYPNSPANNHSRDRHRGEGIGGGGSGGGGGGGGGGYVYQPSPHTLRMPPGRVPAAYHMVVNTDSDDNHSIHATV